MKSSKLVSNAACIAHVVVLLSSARCALAVNPAQWSIVEQINRTDTTKTWTSPTAIDLGKMVWEYDLEITKITGTVNLGIFGNVTEDITESIPPEDRMSSGETRDLPAVVLFDMLVEPETGTSADVFVQIDNAGFGQAIFSNIMLGSVDVPLFGSRPIERINVEATVEVIGYDFGDYNRDGAIDAADYTVWRDTLGSTTELAADGDASGTVDTPDFAVWKTNFSNTGGSGSALGTATIPEPSSAVLAIMGIAAALISGLSTRHFR